MQKLFIDSCMAHKCVLDTSQPLVLFASNIKSDTKVVFATEVSVQETYYSVRNQISCCT